MFVMTPVLGLVLSLLGGPLPETAPPHVDYCQQMEQEIQGRKHGFLAGNKTYYIGGFYPVWKHQEDETIGFTHPFYHDLRCRGRGMVQYAGTGYGHDLSGWEFYKHTKVAYGTVILDGTRYEHPVPVSMVWRPDRMICEYNVAGVAIREEKFIALNDAACTIITASEPVTLEFSGQSFADDKTIVRSATCELDATNNCVHVVEGGISEATPVKGVTQTGPLMYDGMSTVVSASKTLENYAQSETNGQYFYTFTVPCNSNGLSLVWAMDDVYTQAVANVNELLADPAAALAAKTLHMNDLLNHQIPYFRCSDPDIVDVYYYLWALNLMYFIDVGEGFEQYPHTQTAVNNFLGMHRYDANFQIQVGAWTADKHNYANGNVLIWKALLPFSDLETGLIPADNMGQAWYSGLWGSIAGHVAGAWKIYEHSGDQAFLTEAYDFYRSLMWTNIPGFWGNEYTAADDLGKMALALGYPQAEADHWQTVVKRDQFNNWLNNMWQKNGVTNFFGAGSATNRLGWSSFSYLAMDDFPDDWARRMTEFWAMNTNDGFNLQGYFCTTALKDWDLVENKNFMVTPDANWFAIRGMYKHHVDDAANALTLHHLKNYNMRWGIPVAPESLKDTLELHGDEYSNFNAGKILLILEGIFGLSYSVVDDTFTVADNMPPEWSFMETYVPVNEGGQTRWTRVRIDRSEQGGTVTKSVEVEGNTQATLNIEPWMEGKTLQSASSGGITNVSSGHIDYQFTGQSGQVIQIQLTN